MTEYDLDNIMRLSDFERRRLVGTELTTWYQSQGYDRILYVGNIADALPPAARPALERGHAPLDAYQGRLPGMALGLFPQLPVGIRMDRPIYPQEEVLLKELAAFSDSTYPIMGPDIDDDANTFIYPFIGSEKMVAQYGERTLPPAERFNNKAIMRSMLADLGYSHGLTPGHEIFYDQTDVHQFASRTLDEVLTYAGQSKAQKFLVKLANTASGLLNVSLTAEQVRAISEGDEVVRARVHKAIMAMFTSPYENGLFPGDVVVEDYVDYREAESGIGDYNFRGFLTPKGVFVPMSASRQICDASGEYLGMIMANTHKITDLEKIGLHPGALRQQWELMNAAAKTMYSQGYWGQVSFDAFTPQGRSVLGWNRDFNMREGGASVPAVGSSLADKLYGSDAMVLDMEMKVNTGGVLDEQHVGEVLDHMQQHGVRPYATTFLRYPRVNADGRYQYTVKTLSPYRGDALNEPAVRDHVCGVTEAMNDGSIDVVFGLPGNY
ncbi:MAG: hypothetical protein UZ22_OP11002000892 [Microgenomates bacterium OLB23]|nr:MAG: hypothetical protein UZ22_OP11002000892 [Microgenomates bacterium OLB23]